MKKLQRVTAMIRNLSDNTKLSYITVVLVVWILVFVLAYH